MISVRVVSAELRVDQLDFNPREMHRIHVGRYSCPYCPRGVEFNTSDLRRCEGRNGSNLSEEWATRFSEARPIVRQEWESFLDFSCQGCGAPTRIIYRAGHEVAMGAHVWKVTDVVEPVKWKDGESEGVVRGAT